MSRISLGADQEPLVSDRRLSQIFYHLQRLIPFPDGMEFQTRRQEPIVDPNPTLAQTAIAVFVITSPHPKADKRILTPHKLISVATMPFEQWVEANKEYRHYANLTDPLRPIFAGLLRQHMNHRENLQALRDN